MSPSRTAFDFVPDPAQDLFSLVNDPCFEKGQTKTAAAYDSTNADNVNTALALGYNKKDNMMVPLHLFTKDVPKGACAWAKYGASYWF